MIWAERNVVLACIAVFCLAGCGSTAPAGELPTAEVIEAAYAYERTLSAEIVGNVAVLTVQQEPLQLRRGGTLWAKVGPFVFLFSDETRLLFEQYDGLGAVRVITRVGDTEVANALLRADELTDLLWRRSLNIAGKARRDGTTMITLLEDLVDWGEGHTDFTYNPRFTSR